MLTAFNLKDALAAGQLVVHYQPKLNLRAEPVPAVEASEALVRWEHPRLGLLMPASFVPAAEQTDLILPMTEFVLDTAIEQLTRWQAVAPSLAVAVNLAPALLTDLDLPDRVSGILQRHRVDPSRLVLEVTESAAMADTAVTMDILTRLRLKGIALSLDDFGTGYSSLVQLYRMPFSEMKIDRSFVGEIGDNDEAAVIVRSITELAHNLGLSVCAEGVETERALAFLRSVGCDQAQGYLIGRPMPPAYLTVILAGQAGRPAPDGTEPPSTVPAQRIASR